MPFRHTAIRSHVNLPRSACSSRQTWGPFFSFIINASKLPLRISIRSESAFRGRKLWPTACSSAEPPSSLILLFRSSWVIACIKMGSRRILHHEGSLRCQCLAHTSPCVFHAFTADYHGFSMGYIALERIEGIDCKRRTISESCPCVPR